MFRTAVIIEHFSKKKMFNVQRSMLNFQWGYSRRSQCTPTGWEGVFVAPLGYQ